MVGLKERVIYALVFLFPIAGVSVSHWFTAIFTVLVFMALWEAPRWRRQEPLLKSEKIWLVCCAGFFGSFLISALVNGWDVGQTKSVEVDIRYLLVVPLYLMLRRFPKAGIYLLMGCAVAAVALAAQSGYDKLILGLPRAEGFYSPNLLGPVAALVAVWLMAGRGLLPRLKWAVPLLAVAAMYAVLMSGSRGGYLGLLAMVVLWVVLISRSYQRLIALFVVGVIAAAGYSWSGIVKERVDTAAHETSTYLEAENPDALPLGSITWRFEIWKVATKAFLESPVVGVGNKHYNIYSKKYADLGEINPAAVSDGHAHNAYFEVLMSRGMVGFIFFAGMLFYPLYLFARTYRASPATALLGMTHVVGFAIFSLTDASTFVMGNFTAIFLLCMSLFMVWHLDRVKQGVS
jgi:O-antigen ligase